MWSFAKQISGFKILKNNIWEYDEAESEILVKRCIIGLSPIVAATRPKVYRYDNVEKALEISKPWLNSELKSCSSFIIQESHQTHDRLNSISTGCPKKRLALGK